MMAVIELKNLVKRYGVGTKAVQVLHNVSAEIHDGEFVVIVGPSGCGKSTLLRMVAGLEDITEGEIRIGNNRVNDLEPSKRDIAMVFQNYALYPHMSVFDNMAYGLKIAKVSIEDIKKRVHAAASALELSHLLERKPRELSGGQRQRVAMGRAIVRQPQVFLFDEPLSNLDAKLRAHTRLEIQKLHRELGTTSLFVTHDQVEAMTLAQRMLVMHEGRLQQFGTPEEVYNRPANTFVAGFIGAPPMNLLHEVSGIDAEMILGIRPEHLHIKNASHADGRSNAYSWAAQVYALEMLGAERLVYARIGQENIVLRTDVTSDVPEIGGTLELIAHQHQVHWFDKKTGLRRS
jgi:sn-glycerol 3-phosphate transport system ATP-binding protein